MNIVAHHPSAETRLRSDARRNRERLLAAAEGIFLERGADASLDDVARRAGVGIGTLYRRFPTREALLAAMCDDKLSAVAEASRSSAASSAPDVMLRAFVEELAAVTVLYRGLAASIGVVLGHPTSGCAATTAEARRLLAQAQAVGSVRTDVNLEDIVCVIAAAATAADGSSDRRSRIARVVDLFFHGIGRSPERIAVGRGHAIA